MLFTFETYSFFFKYFDVETSYEIFVLEQFLTIFINRNLSCYPNSYCKISVDFKPLKIENFEEEICQSDTLKVQWKLKEIEREKRKRLFFFLECIRNIIFFY